MHVMFRDFPAASEHCNSMGAKLAEPLTAAEAQALVTKYGQVNFWIGVTDEKREGE